MNYFGSQPNSYELPLISRDNLNDVPDKTLARQNLGAASIDDVLKAANPIGTIIAVYGSVSPYGYLPCEGQTVSKAAYPDLVNFLNPTGNSAVLPDLRGEFLRGWDNGRGVDAGRVLGSSQLDLIKEHSHPLPIGAGGSESLPYKLTVDTLGNDSYTGAVSSLVGGVETRPRNVAVLYCIKAYDTPVSLTSLNVAALASELGTKLDLSSFTGINQSRTANGYQKIPGGMIIQWGSVPIIYNDLETSFTFPISFPSECFTVVTSVKHSSQAGWTLGAYVKKYTSSSCTLIGDYAGTPVTAQATWIALGY